jgi:UDP-N-acetylglucosamine 2-epimerase (non-hydrolysing)
MKVMTVLGTRPEIIRLSRIIPALDSASDHVLVHTGQNYMRTLHDIFFEELGVRQPDHILECRSNSQMEQIGRILVECERVIALERPDRILILGDTNSALSAVVAKRMGIPVFHMEAGNRCYDDRVPEEVNRRIVDHCSDILMPYTERSRANLLREGIEGRRICVTGNPIFEVLNFFGDEIGNSSILKKLGLKKGEYFLVTLHRAENVDMEDRLKSFVTAFHALHKQYGLPVICSVHPRTRSQLEQQGITMEGGGVSAMEPFGLFDFVNLEKNALCVMTDSGTVQEECCILGIPAVTLRDVTERPETLECGSNILSGAEPESIVSCVRTVLGRPGGWEPPGEYLVRDVTGAVLRIVMGFHIG